MRTVKPVVHGFAILMLECAALAVATNAASAQKLPGTTSDVRVGGTTITPISADVPRLGLELLTLRGDPILVNTSTTYSCATYGNNYVLVGLKVRHRVTTLVGIDLFCAPLRSDGTLGATIFRPATTPPDGTPQEAKCPSGQVVVGYQGTKDDSKSSAAHLRSIVLHCARLNSRGLIEGSATKLLPLGVNSGISFGPDTCTGGRPARELRLRSISLIGSPTTVGVWQLGCEQPVKP